MQQVILQCTFPIRKRCFTQNGTYHYWQSNYPPFVSCLCIFARHLLHFHVIWSKFAQILKFINRYNLTITFFSFISKKSRTEDISGYASFFYLLLLLVSKMQNPKFGMAYYLWSCFPVSMEWHIIYNSAWVG